MSSCTLAVSATARVRTCDASAEPEAAPAGKAAIVYMGKVIRGRCQALRLDALCGTRRARVPEQRPEGLASEGLLRVGAAISM